MPNENTVTAVVDDLIPTPSRPFDWGNAIITPIEVFRPSRPTATPLDSLINFQEETFCDECGSRDVSTDGTIVWDAAANQYTVSDVYGEWWCCNCDNNVDVTFHRINRRIER